MVRKSEEIIFYSGATEDTMIEVARLYSNGKANPSSWAISNEDVVNYFTRKQQAVMGTFPQTWKFSMELGTDDSKDDGVKIDDLLDSELGPNGEDSMYIDYFAFYEPTY